MRDLLRGPRLLQIAMVLGDFDRFPISFLGVPTEVCAYPPDELRQVVTDAGFEITELRGVAASGIVVHVASSSGEAANTAAQAMTSMPPVDTRLIRQPICCGPFPRLVGATILTKILQRG